MKQYLDGLRTILEHGFDSEPARDNMPTTKIYNDLQMQFDLRDNKLPIITTKQMPFRSITAELLCFMAGVTDVRTYDAMGCNVWWDNAYKWNIYESSRTTLSIEDYKKYGTPDNKDNRYYDLGRIYAAQWRNWFGMIKHPQHGYINTYVDQLNNLIESIKSNPESRYHVMTAWNPAEMNNDTVSQPNCHVYFQVTCRKLSYYEREKLYRKTKFGAEMIGEPTEEHDMDNIPKYAIRTHLTQRSCDMFLGVPFNITSYSLLTHILARLTNTVAEEFVWNGVNCHIYSNHMNQVNELLNRTPYEVPTIEISNTIESLDDIEWFVKNPNTFKRTFKDTFELTNYKYHPKLSGDLSVGL